MSVILPNCQLSVAVRQHPWPRDARGVPLPSTDPDASTTRGPEPGGAQEQADGSWLLRLDSALWPVRAGDRISDDQGRTWVAAPDPKLYTNPASAALDYIDVTGTLDPPRVP